MGEGGYSILIWDDWGGGLVKINARLHAEGTDLYGNPNNWWPCKKDTTDREIAAKHDLRRFAHFLIIRD